MTTLVCLLNACQYFGAIENPSQYVQAYQNKEEQASATACSDAVCITAVYQSPSLTLSQEILRGNLTTQAELDKRASDLAANTHFLLKFADGQNGQGQSPETQIRKLISSLEKGKVEMLAAKDHAVPCEFLQVEARGIGPQIVHVIFPVSLPDNNITIRLYFGNYDFIDIQFDSEKLHELPVARLNLNT